jgi:hypothetical protein
VKYLAYRVLGAGDNVGPEKCRMRLRRPSDLAIALLGGLSCDSEFCPDSLPRDSSSLSYLYRLADLALASSASQGGPAQ